MQLNRKIFEVRKRKKKAREREKTNCHEMYIRRKNREKMRKGVKSTIYARRKAKIGTKTVTKIQLVRINTMHELSTLLPLLLKPE